MNVINHPLDPEQWIKVPSRKFHVVWHGTGFRTSATPFNDHPGSISSVIASWQYCLLKTGVPWLVDRDGTVVSTFPDTDWAFHLSPGVVAPDGKFYTNGVMDKMSIGIEIANELALKEQDGKYYPHGNVKPTNQYNGPVLIREFRGADNYADLSPEQADALIELTLDCCSRHKIEPVFYRGGEFNPKSWEVATIIRHCNCHPKVKDLPVADWVLDKISTAGIKIV
jgi:hypothetical protein